MTVSMDELVALCKRRGFIYPASEIYGGINGFWDYGPLGVVLKNNIRDSWWQRHGPLPADRPRRRAASTSSASTRSIIQNPKAWEASGHVGGFSDPMVDCRETKARYRADHVKVLRHKSNAALPLFAFMEGEPEAGAQEGRQGREARRERRVRSSCRCRPCPRDSCARVIGPDAEHARHAHRAAPVQPDVRDVRRRDPGRETRVAYLRPETAQGIFLNFKNVVDTTRVKVPFGIAQIGKASATRSRRATSSSARASSSRWRWSGSATRTRP